MCPLIAMRITWGTPARRIDAVQVDPAAHPDHWKIPLEDHVLDGLLTPAQICGSLPDVEQGRQDIGATQAREFHPEQGSNQLLE